MPILKAAKKKLKQDKRREAENRLYRLKYRKALKLARLKKTKESIKTASQALDRAAKKRVIHKNKAARLKSRLAKSAK